MGSVMCFPEDQVFNSSTALVNLSRNSSLISSCTYNIFKAVIFDH